MILKAPIVLKAIVFPKTTSKAISFSQDRTLRNYTQHSLRKSRRSEIIAVAVTVDMKMVTMSTTTRIIAIRKATKARARDLLSDVGHLLLIVDLL
jgi:hypothetical protein